MIVNLLIIESPLSVMTCFEMKVNYFLIKKKQKNKTLLEQVNIMCDKNQFLFQI